MYINYQPNPYGLDSAGDCVVRAISKVMDKSWEDTYLELTAYAFSVGDIFSANNVWISYLLNHGFREHSLMSMCKDCYTLEKFVRDIKPGVYCVSSGEHAVAVIKQPNEIDGKYFDSWDSKNMVPIFYLEKINDNKEKSNE